MKLMNGVSYCPPLLTKAIVSSYQQNLQQQALFWDQNVTACTSYVNSQATASEISYWEHPPPRYTAHSWHIRGITVQLNNRCLHWSSLWSFIQVNVDCIGINKNPNVIDGVTFLYISEFQQEAGNVWPGGTREGCHSACLRKGMVSQSREPDRSCENWHWQRNSGFHIDAHCTRRWKNIKFRLLNLQGMGRAPVSAPSIRPSFHFRPHSGCSLNFDAGIKQSCKPGCQCLARQAVSVQGVFWEPELCFKEVDAFKKLSQTESKRVDHKLFTQGNIGEVSFVQKWEKAAEAWSECWRILIISLQNKCISGMWKCSRIFRCFKGPFYF